MDEDRLRRHDLTDGEWVRLAPLLPAHPRQGHRWNDHRLVINGIFFRARAGCSWRDLPGCGTGTGRPSITGIAAGRGMGRGRGSLTSCALGVMRRRGQAWAVAVDSTIVRAHQHAAGARRRSARRYRSCPAGARRAERPGAHRGLSRITRTERP